MKEQFYLLFSRRETLSFILREDHRLRVFKNRLLSKLFGPMREGMTENRKKLDNKEPHNMYYRYPPNRSFVRMLLIKSRKMRWNHIAHTREMNAHKIVVIKTGVTM